MSSYTFSPIAYFRTSLVNPYETASQGHLDQSGEEGLVEFVAGFPAELATRGLENMSHVWLLFAFHQKSDWRPLVSPPRGTTEKQGVLATRSPHRPNPLGLSLVEITAVEPKGLRVRGFDLLNDTPIFDLKPYHPGADVAASPRLGWMQHLEDEAFAIETAGDYRDREEWLLQRGVVGLAPFVRQQLRFEPFREEKKRVIATGDRNFELAYRTWRIDFEQTDDKNLRLLTLRTGYSEVDLAPDSFDKWGDKDLHREFIKIFGR